MSEADVSVQELSAPTNCRPSLRLVVSVQHAFAQSRQPRCGLGG